MKIGIITFHFAHNHGAVLQCYALQKKLEMQGHEVEIIDYRPKYHTVRYDVWKNPFRYAVRMYRIEKGSCVFCKLLAAIKSFIQCMIWNVQGRDKVRAKMFSDFLKNNLEFTRRYTTLKDLQKNPPVMDVYISGSDQLWNPDLLNFAFDPAYFLKFGKDNCKRFTYAVSVGKEPSIEECQQLRDLCKGLTAVSLREQTPAIVEAIEREVHICIDPTLLLDAEDYYSIECDSMETEPYIFVYGFDNSPNIHEAVNEAITRNGCRVINGSPDRIKLAQENVENIRNYAPGLFLALIKNAECVVTNSFHGTAFSIIYKKKFVTVPHPTSGRRMIELLEKLGLQGVLWGTSNFSFDNEINYVKVYENIQNLRGDSLNYLNQALEGCCGEYIQNYKA